MKPNHILVAGPCRSGTTFIFNALASDRYIGVFQPVKHILRSKLAAIAPGEFAPNGSRGQNMIIKESFGPYFLEEVRYDPVIELQSVLGIFDPKLILVMRNPLDCFASWLKSFSLTSKEAEPVFIESYRHTYSLYERYKNQLDVQVVILDEGEDLQRKIRLIQDSIRGPNDTGHYASLEKKRDPAEFEVRGLLTKAFSSQDYNKAFITQAGHDIDIAQLSRAKSYYTLFCNLI